MQSKHDDGNIVKKSVSDGTKSISLFFEFAYQTSFSVLCCLLLILSCLEIKERGWVQVAGPSGQARLVL